jgi:hypothetical protein
MGCITILEIAPAGVFPLKLRVGYRYSNPSLDRDVLIRSANRAGTLRDFACCGADETSFRSECESRCRMRPGPGIWYRSRCEQPGKTLCG